MKLHDLKPSKGSKKRRTRVGRGISAGKGKYAGRGIKGQGARSGGGKGPYFEGGQLPLVRRLPMKRGFTNIFRIKFQEVNVDYLEKRFEDGATVTPQAMQDAGLIRESDQPIAILGRGELNKNLTVHAHRVTKGAEEKIKNAGGEVVLLEEELKTFKDNRVAVTAKKLRKEDLAEIFSE